MVLPIFQILGYRIRKPLFVFKQGAPCRCLDIHSRILRPCPRCLLLRHALSLLRHALSLLLFPFLGCRLLLSSLPRRRLLPFPGRRLLLSFLGLASILPLLLRLGLGRRLLLSFLDLASILPLLLRLGLGRRLLHCCRLIRRRHLFLLIIGDQLLLDCQRRNLRPERGQPVPFTRTVNVAILYARPPSIDLNY